MSQTLSSTPIESAPTPAGAPATSQTVSFEQIAPADVRRWLKDGSAVLIDVREPDEHARERIEGASLLPLSKFDARQALARAGAGQRVVFHCKSGRRSADAARIAAALGQGGARVCTMTGGIEAWKQQGLPVELDTKAPGLSIMRQVQLIVGVGTLAGTALGFWLSPWLLIIPAFLGAGLAFAGATGTCALASLLALAPWNRTNGVGKSAPSCSSGSCCS